jgi:hypothetical protein
MSAIREAKGNDTFPLPVSKSPTRTFCDYQ